ncbi:Aste57867_1433 [Aphanomyces stellatus]|uniref:Aste57867_1433 protein n=1 Tax=Aphanomyces stellatus TaxID=120398 RepID=A0A485K7U5_9STRA|nr:hypothetical protein As57867_001432 [Aphanomyces stellatus]VFT78650.1 Aste57867_1433 [Aphanomyces stellatus]
MRVVVVDRQPTATSHSISPWLRVPSSIEMKRAAFESQVVVEISNHRRHRGKVYQRVYRAEQKETNSRRLAAITALKMEIARLEGRAEGLRDAVPAPLRTFALETHVMAEYFRLFAQGYKGEMVGRVQATQQDFLVSTLREDIVFMDDVGVEKLVAQWKLYTTVFASFAMEVRSISVVAFSPEVVVLADAKMYLRISRLTIETIFRHLLHDEVLVQCLVGQVLELPMQMHFAFDTNFKVIRYDTHANIVVGLSNLLGTFEDTVSALRHCQMRENAEITVRAQEVDRVLD